MTPGSLSKTQDTEVLAFILANNGYPAGSAPLDAARLDELLSLPFPEQTRSPTPSFGDSEHRQRQSLGSGSIAL